jgi:hypothetical protein
MTGVVSPSIDATTSPSITWPKIGRSRCRAVAAEMGYDVDTLMALSSWGGLK